MRTHHGASYLYVGCLLTIVVIGIVTRPDKRLRAPPNLELSTVPFIGIDIVIGQPRIEVNATHIHGDIPSTQDPCRQRDPASSFDLAPVTASPALRWAASNGRVCGVAIRAGAFAPLLFPDGRIPYVLTAHVGNVSTGLCLAGVGGWRPDFGINVGIYVHKMIRNDNQAILNFSSFNLTHYAHVPLVPCTSYYSRPATNECLEPIDVLVAGFTGIQTVRTLAADTLVTGITLRPRNPWRTPGPWYSVVSAWGIPFEAGPDGSYTANLMASGGHWSDLLGPTIVRTTCGSFLSPAVGCKPFPLDIYVCFDECPCVFLTPTTTATTTPTTTPTTTATTTPTTTPTTTATTTPTTTPTTTTTTLPTCQLVVTGGHCTTRSAMPRLNGTEYVMLNKTLANYSSVYQRRASANDYSRTFTFENPALVPLRATRLASCVDRCFRNGTMCASADNAGTYGTVVRIQGHEMLDSPVVALSSRDLRLTAPTYVDPRVVGSTHGLVTFTHGGYCMHSSFVAQDCCYDDAELDPAASGGTRVRSYNSVSLVVSEGLVAWCSGSATLQPWSIPLLMLTHEYFLVEKVVDIRSHLNAAVFEASAEDLVAVAAFDPEYFAWSVRTGTLRFVRWEVGTLLETYASGSFGNAVVCTSGSDCSIRIVLRGRNDWSYLLWTLYTDFEVEVSLSIWPLFSNDVSDRPQCMATNTESSNTDYARSQFDIPMELMVWYAVSPACVPHDPMPTDDAPNLLERVIAGESVASACTPGKHCVDAR